jgi:hypothetical protein
VLPDWYVDDGNISLYYAEHKLLPGKTRAFIDFVVEQFAEQGLAGRFNALQALCGSLFRALVLAALAREGAGSGNINNEQYLHHQAHLVIHLLAQQLLPQRRARGDHCHQPITLANLQPGRFRPEEQPALAAASSSSVTRLPICTPRAGS